MAWILHYPILTPVKSAGKSENPMEVTEMSPWIAEIDERLDGARWRHYSATLETRAIVEDTLLIAQAIGYGQGVASGVLVRGMCLLIQGKREEAFTDFLAALRLSRDLSQNNLTADCLHGMGIIHSGRAEYQEALCCYRGVLRLRCVLGDERGQITALNSLGTIHTTLGNRTEAAVCYTNSRCIARQLGDSRSEMIAASNLGILHFDLHNYTEGISELESAISLAEQRNDSPSAITPLTYLCRLLTEIEQYEKAEAAGQKAWERAKESGNPAREVGVLQALGGLYTRMGRSEEAAQILLKVLAYSAVNSTTQDIPDIYRELGRIAEGRGAFRSAEILYHQGHEAVSDNSAYYHRREPLNSASA